MNIYNKIVLLMIKEQEVIIGPIAWEEAERVRGLKVNKTHRTIEVEGDNKVVINNLVKQYSRLFGRASEEVCREAIKDFLSQIPSNKIPDSLVSNLR